MSLSECPCLPEISGYSNDSLSGQYIDNIEHGINLKLNSSSDCGEGSIWDVMSSARDEAIEDFATYFNIALSKYQVPRYIGYQGFFGEKSKKGNANRNGLRAINGFCIFPKKHYQGATLCINRIAIGINGMDDYDIQILRLDGEVPTVVETVTVTVDSTFEGSVSTNISLPISDEYGRPICYALAYDTKGNKPKDYKYHCGCSSVPKPNWMKDKIVNAKGFSVANFANVNRSSCTSDYTNGLIADFSIKCDPFDWLCDQDDDFWKCNNFGRVLAKVLVLMTNSKLAHRIVNMEQPDFYSLLSKEHLYGKIKKYNRLVEELIDYLVTDGLPEQMKCCLVCNPKRSLGFKKQAIIV